MEKIYLYNSLTRKEETFKPLKKGIVKMYSCGPTVYNYAHIGNHRTNIFNDVLKRTLAHNNLKVTHVMNMTDVDDKTIKASQKEGMPLQQLTRKYEEIFLKELEELNIIMPSRVLRATENIEEMILLIKKLIAKKYAYKTSDGIYFSIDKFKGYGNLSQLQKTKKTKSRIIADEYDKSCRMIYNLPTLNDFVRICKKRLLPDKPGRAGKYQSTILNTPAFSQRPILFFFKVFVCGRKLMKTSATPGSCSDSLQSLL